MEQQFRIIKDFENYSVSNFGNVRNDKTGRILKPIINSNRYYAVNLCNEGKIKFKKIHILVAKAFIDNPTNKKCVDHIDNNRLNNNIDNLRFASYGENNMNSKIRSDNTSNYKGVTFNKNSKKWRAFIQVDGKNKHLGYFDSIEEANNVRVKKAKEIFGEFINDCEKEITINLNVPNKIKLNFNVNVQKEELQV